MGNNSRRSTGSIWLAVFGPKPTWQSYASWCKWSVYCLPYCVALSLVFFWASGGSQVVGLICAVVCLIGLVQAPRNWRRYRIARQRMHDGEPNPPDMQTLLKTLRR